MILNEILHISLNLRIHSNNALVIKAACVTLSPHIHILFIYFGLTVGKSVGIFPSLYLLLLLNFL